MRTFFKIVAWLSNICGVISAAMIAASAFVVCEMVFLRYAVNTPTYWQTEFVIYTLIASVFIGGPYVLLTRGHVSVDLLALYLGPRAAFVVALLSALISFTFCVIITWAGYLHWLEIWQNGWRSGTVWNIHLWIPWLALPVGMGLLSLQYVADILALVTGHRSALGEPSESAL